MSLRTTCDPSNLLYHGEARDFPHAMALVVAQCDAELRLARDGEDDDLRRSLDGFKAAARQALARYAERVKAAERELAEELQRGDDDHLRLIGAALADGDYSRLAI